MSALHPSRPDRGVVLVVSGPSGVGKSTLIGHVRERLPDLAFSVSATTRAPRPGERDGVDYAFLDDAAFRTRLAAGDFLEHAEVYGHLYGTPRRPVEALVAEGRSVLLDIDAQGAAQVRHTLPEAVHVMILPPCLDELERRLRSRGTDSDAVIARRMAQAGEQVRAAPGYDYLVVNDDLDTACAQLLGVLLAELARLSRQRSHLHALLGSTPVGRAG